MSHRPRPGRAGGCRGGARTRHRAGVPAAALAVALACFGATGLAGQRAEPPPRAVTAVDADSIRVGEPFSLGVTVATDRATDVAFPPLLALAEPLEQRGAVRVRPGDEGRRWRAYYTLVAWRPGRLEMPTFEVELRDDSGGGTRTLTVAPAAVRVLSVLPPDEEVELREARPFLRLSNPIWPWVLAGLALLALAAWWWRRRARRATAPAAAEPADPGEQALAALERLGRAWGRGELAPQELYDRLEATLRGFASATRGWEPGRSLRGLSNGDGDLASALELSTRVRFARLRPPEGGPRRSIEAASAFVRRQARTAQAAREEAPASEGRP